MHEQSAVCLRFLGLFLRDCVCLQIVHAATWRDQKVAVKKVLLPENMRPEQQLRLVEDFKCEVDICCRLTHPRLVAFLGYTVSPP